VASGATWHASSDAWYDAISASSFTSKAPKGNHPNRGNVVVLIVFTHQLSDLVASSRVIVVHYS
jgi:hypothetical protein